MKLVYGLQKWSAVEDGNRISTMEITEETDWFDTQAEALNAVEKILNEKPAGVARVTVARFDENGEIYDDNYLLDAKIA